MHGAQYHFTAVVCLLIGSANKSTAEESCQAGKDSCLAGESSLRVDRLEASAPAEFAAHVASRRPVLAVGGCNSTAHAFAADRLKRMYGSENIVVVAVPPAFVDPRPSNILGMYFWKRGMAMSMRPETCEYMSTVSDFVRFIHLPADRRKGPKEWDLLPDEEGCHNHPKHRNDPVWKGTHMYWRASLPSDGEYDELGPKLFSYMEDTLGIFEGNPPAAGPGWIADETYVRAGSGNYTYPLHMDCYPNLLYNYWGEKEVLLYDLKAFWQRRPDMIFKMFEPTSIKDMLGAMPEMIEHVYIATLRPGDVLYIPVLWMHEVKYGQPGFGSNHFYRHPEHEDTALCEFVKGSMPKTLKGGILSEDDIFKATAMSTEKDAPSHYSEYSKRLGLQAFNTIM